MDPLDFLDDEQLLRFFHCNKTEMSCMEKPQTFLNKLRDHNLVPEDDYKKVIRMKSKDNIKTGLYGILDWLESERPQHIRLFWTCVFTESIINQYPVLRLLRNSLFDGSFQFSGELPERVERIETKEEKRKQPAENEDEEGKRGKTGGKKRQKTKHIDNEDEQPSTSSQMTPGQKKKLQKPTYGSPLKKGQMGDIWNWPIYKTQLPVTCGKQEGTLNRDRLAKGMKCIVVDNKWFTPIEFEKFSGKTSFKNWKLSIRCRDTTLGKLIKDGHLKTPGYKRASTKKSLFPSDQSQDTEDEDEEVTQDEEDQKSTSDEGSLTDFTEDESEEEEESPQQSPGGSHDSNNKKVFRVTCGALTGTLHKSRFATGTRGKSIRTEKCWMTPVEFVQEGCSDPDASWKKDIEWEGNPLGALFETKAMEIHSVLCKCRFCKPDQESLENQKNDDECFICRSHDEEDLVVCDHCPRSFHPKCHLPHVTDSMLRDNRQWMCTFCVLRTTQQWLRTAQVTCETVLSRPISQHLMECQYLLLSLYNADEDQIFATDPRHHVRDYATSVKTPIWLEKISEKLQKKCYQTVGEFESDVQLIFSNCAAFNRDNEEFRIVGVTLKEFFDREFKNVFRIQEETDQ
ncbi:nuclear body protein SP140-like protein [Myripristis murdjan]|uniref:nuclear body protein SP140-like protein n=1 Tax=Myripristis murdjan TaxID=586833 RepID=UPI00117634FC|nr:nuclear body protein SP140-like protein [Myripristis murdjan]